MLQSFSGDTIAKLSSRIDSKQVSLEGFEYRKFPKFSDTGKIGCNHSKIRTKRLNHSVMHPNGEDRMANSVDPDQTAPLGAV